MTKNQTAQNSARHHQSEMHDLVTVYTSSGLLGAEVIKGRLESEGIQALLKYESAASMLPLTVDGLGEVRVLVRREDEAKAREILSTKSE